jgi:peptidyl-prolyl cis-trans isomerase C
MSLFLASMLGFACTKEAAKDAAPTDKDKQSAAKSSASKPAASGSEEGEEAPIEMPKIDGPVATVNGVEIPPDKFLVEFKGTLERYRRARHPVKPQLRERLKDNLVRRLVDSEIIKQKAKEMKIVIESKLFEEKWQAHKKRYGKPEAFAAFLDRTGETVERMKEQFRLNILREQVFAAVSAQVVVTGEDMTAFYEKNKEKYNEREKIKASHILFRVDPKASAADKAKKKGLAQKVLKKAKAKGADFAKLAAEFGEDPTKTRGGDLGYFTKGRMVKDFENAAWKLKKGQVSNLVKTQFGFHIIKKTDFQAATQKAFTDVKDQIARTLKAQLRNNAVREALTNWRKEAKIEIFVKGDPEVINAQRKALQLKQRGIGQPIQIVPKAGKK